MAGFYDAQGQLQQVEITPAIYKEAHDANLSVKALINRKFGANKDLGTAYDQIKVSCGLVVPKGKDFGLRAPTIADIMDGKASFNAAAGVISQGNGSPFGNESRTLFPAAVIDMMEEFLVRDYETDRNIFDTMIAQEISVSGDHFEQPIVNYRGFNGPEAARAQRIAQLAEPASMVRFTTSDKFRKIPTYGIGVEFSQQALRTSTLDIVGLSLARYMQVERDSWVYIWINDILNGEGDINIGALPSVGTKTFDPAAPTGTMTHKAWVKWLYRNRKIRRIDACIMDIDTYLKVEGRSGRPGLTDYDATLSRIDPQGTAINPQIGDVRIFLVDSAAEGGPLPANTIIGLDTRYAMARVTNLEAAYTATEAFALRRSEAFRMDFGQIVYRLHDEAFDVLTIE